MLDGSTRREDPQSLLGRHLNHAGPIDIASRTQPRSGFEDVATVELAIDDISIRAIMIDEVIASRRSSAAPKDTAALPTLYATCEAPAGGQRYLRERQIRRRCMIRQAAAHRVFTP
jgi:hypothetical protein